MLEGVVLKAYGGFFYVHDGQQVWECKPRGKFKKDKQTIMAGDKVDITPTAGETGVIERVQPRRTELLRPPIANVEQVLVVMAGKDPEPNLSLLDRLLVMAEQSGVQPVICFSKWDLVAPGELDQEITGLEQAGYQVLTASVKTGVGIEEVRKVLSNRISVFAGPSGAGKSTLLNAIQPGLDLKTGEISEKIKRGKHTTRHVELLPLHCGGWVADTPGFSTLNLPAMEKEELGELFPEIWRYINQCKFNSCLHRQEPGCAVREAAESGEIYNRRYEQYLVFLAEVLEQKERRY